MMDRIKRILRFIMDFIKYENEKLEEDCSYVKIGDIYIKS